ANTAKMTRRLSGVYRVNSAFAPTTNYRGLLQWPANKRFQRRTVVRSQLCRGLLTSLRQTHIGRAREHIHRSGNGRNEIVTLVSKYNVTEFTTAVPRLSRWRSRALSMPKRTDYVTLS